MADPYIGEIRLFAGNFEPVPWAFCDGRALPISQHDALFQLIGTNYGGDGQNTFNLPDLRGRAPVHQGTSSFGTIYQIGENGGVEQVTLAPQQIPSHTHPYRASTAPGNASNPQGRVVASPPGITPFIPDAPSQNLAATIVAPVGGSQPHENRTPFVAINYIIALEGVFPPQN